MYHSCSLQDNKIWSLYAGDAQGRAGRQADGAVPSVVKGLSGACVRASIKAGRANNGGDFPEEHRRGELLRTAMPAHFMAGWAACSVIAALAVPSTTAAPSHHMAPHSLHINREGSEALAVAPGMQLGWAPGLIIQGVPGVPWDPFAPP